MLVVATGVGANDAGSIANSSSLTVVVTAVGTPVVV